MGCSSGSARSSGLTARRHLAVLGIASIVGLAACVAPQGDTTRTPVPSGLPGALVAQRGAGGDLQILYWQAPSTLNPHLATGPKDSDASRLALEPLASLGKDGQAILLRHGFSSPGD